MAVLLAISISLDSLAIGISYGMKNIRVSTGALLIIAMTSVAALLLSWAGGAALVSVVSSDIAKMASSVLLICLGLFFFLQAALDCAYPDTGGRRIIKKIRLKPFNLIINIIREPASGDQDRSGVIDCTEAWYIGAAMSVDAISVGMAAAAYEMNILLLACLTGMMTALFIKSGEFLGSKASGLASKGRLKFVSGAIILCMGIVRLI